MANQLEITLVRSPIGKVPKHQRTIRALGLRKLNHSVLVGDTPQIRGMINHVQYMLNVREIND